MDLQVVGEQQGLFQRSETVIKVIGTGGGGCNAIDRMVEFGLDGVQFIAANTDLQSLGNSKAQYKIPLGRKLTGGLGAGGKPEVGEHAAEEDKEAIQNALMGAEMVFVTTGMGGGTGSGSAPVIARIARELGALTVAIVTTPFDFEGARKKTVADSWVKKLAAEVDTIITIPNQNLMKVVDRGTSIMEAFAKADDVLRIGVQGISDLITHSGFINIDFADVNSVMHGQGAALLGVGLGNGDNGPLEAAEEATKNQLLDNCNIDGAKGLLVNVTGGPRLSLMDYDDIINQISSRVDPEAQIKCGMIQDEAMGDSVKVTVVATGFSMKTPEESREEKEKIKEEKEREVMPFPKFVGLLGGEAKKAEDYPLSGNKTEESNLSIPTVLRDKKRREWDF